MGSFPMSGMPLNKLWELRADSSTVNSPEWEGSTPVVSGSKNSWFMLKQSQEQVVTGVFLSINCRVYI